MDPAEVRRKNLLPAFTEPHRTAFGAVYDSGDYAAALDQALAAAGYPDLRDEQAKRRAAGDAVQLGIGLASYVEITGGPSEAGLPRENATVEVHPDGSATILTGTSPHGQGHSTVWAMLASEELGIPVEAITVKWGDTNLIPEGDGTGGSRSLQLGGAAVRQASQELLAEARGRAAHELEANPADLAFDTGRSAFTVAGDPDASVPLARLAETERLVVRTVFSAPGPTAEVASQVNARPGRDPLSWVTAGCSRVATAVLASDHPSPPGGLEPRSFPRLLGRDRRPALRIDGDSHHPARPVVL